MGTDGKRGQVWGSVHKIATPQLSCCDWCIWRARAYIILWSPTSLDRADLEVFGIGIHKEFRVDFHQWLPPISMLRIGPFVDKVVENQCLKSFAPHHGPSCDRNIGYATIHWDISPSTSSGQRHHLFSWGFLFTFIFKLAGGSSHAFL